MENEKADAGRERFGLSRETKFSGANRDREIFLSLLIHTLLNMMTMRFILYTYIIQMQVQQNRGKSPRCTKIYLVPFTIHPDIVLPKQYHFVEGWVPGRFWQDMSNSALTSKVL